MIEAMGWIGIVIGVLTAAPKLFALSTRKNRTQVASSVARYREWSRLYPSLLMASVGLVLLTQETGNDWAVWLGRSAFLALVCAELIMSLRSWVRDRGQKGQ